MPGKLETEIEAVLDDKVRPVLRAHDGDIKLLSIDESGGIVNVELHGACATCPSSQETMTETVESAIKEACPWVREVRIRTGVSEELINEALRFLRRSKPSDPETLK